MICRVNVMVGPSFWACGSSVSASPALAHLSVSAFADMALKRQIAVVSNVVLIFMFKPPVCVAFRQIFGRYPMYWG
jgi:hypothetical protein